MEKQILTKEILNKMRSLEGFPIGLDEDIINYSIPITYTICPNPWINDFIKSKGKEYDESRDNYNKKPFAFDVKEGKEGPIYMALSYYTKVPHRAIMKFLLHYTEPGEIVYDGFCGSGMTGIACSLCGDIEELKSLGLILDDEKVIDKENNLSYKKGIRNAILNDLSPFASFLAFNYNYPQDSSIFLSKLEDVINEVEKELIWTFETKHPMQQSEKDLFLDDVKEKKGYIEYTVWSDVFICTFCGNEIIFWDNAVDYKNKVIKDEMICPKCNSKLNKKTLKRKWETKYDPYLKKAIKQVKQIPVLLKYTIEIRNKNGKRTRKREERPLNKEDYELFQRIENFKYEPCFPIAQLPIGYNTKQPINSNGFTHIHHFFSARNLLVLSKIISKLKERSLLNNFSLMVVLSSLIGNSKLYKFRFDRKMGNVSGTLYIPSLWTENNPIKLLRRKLSDISKIPVNRMNNILIQTSSGTRCILPNNCIDYIFTDPPFGGNKMYSELNFFLESWIRVITNNSEEAIINDIQKKGIIEYQNLMEKCFKENFRILKPGRWMTVEFHNSENAIWNAIQEAIQKSGFIIADVKILDKKQGTFKQVTTTTSVKKDLIISSYKPKSSFQKLFVKNVENENSVWDFLKEHLSHLPIFIEKNKKLELVIERQKYLLFDRMVAFYIQHGYIVPISAGDFYKQIQERFPERDGMYFLPNQVTEYDQKKLVSSGTIQLQLFITNEKSALSWLRNELKNSAQTYSEIMPNFMQQILSLEKYEKMPELSVLLEQNFIKDENGKWNLPNPSKESDLEKVRFKHLIKEFNTS